MRHHLSGRQLSRNAPHRRAMLRNMAAALLRYETIRTTLPKAKELRRLVEPLITLAKKDSEAARRRAFAQLRDKELVEKLFTDIGPHYASRPGGYTRILHMVPRPGDAAPMALMQLVDRPDKSAASADTTAPAQEPADEEEAKPRKSAKKKAPGKATARKAPAKAAKKKTAKKAAKKKG